MLFLLYIIDMMVATCWSQDLITDQTITFMNCVSCENYFEVNISTVEMAGIVALSDTVNIDENLDQELKISIQEFFNQYPEETNNVFFKPKDSNINLIVVSKFPNENTRSMYMKTQYYWVQSVDTQEFDFFDLMLSYFRDRNKLRQKNGRFH